MLFFFSFKKKKFKKKKNELLIIEVIYIINEYRNNIFIMKINLIIFLSFFIYLF